MTNSDAFEAEYPMAARLHRRDVFFARADREAAAGLRGIMDAFGAARFCRRPPCRRAGVCVAPKIDCAFRELAALQRYVFPALRQAAAAKGLIDATPWNGARLRESEER